MLLSEASGKEDAAMAVKQSGFWKEEEQTIGKAFHNFGQ